MRKSIDFINLSKSNIQLFFELSLSETNEDYWGFMSNFKRELLVSSLVDKYTSAFDKGIKL
jgi:hypothetical protein